MNFQIAVLMPYFNRPILVKNALNSILRSDCYYRDWRLFFCDDGSPIPGKPIVEEILHDHLNKITFAETGMSFEDKMREGLVLGRLANWAINRSDADAVIILSDDDELVPTYLRDLTIYFKQHPEVMYCYSKVKIYNPLLFDSKALATMADKYNKEGLIDPRGMVDASQVAWRLKCCKEYGAWFKENTKLVPGKPWLADTDRSFFEQLYLKCGPCYPTGLVAQYKGVHDYQLLWHKNAPEISLLEYYEMVSKLGGTKF